ncbi:MAG TPA: hypothetical protein VLH40_07110 [Atribacteraceae bacterium]|nr:hypothetical protein [Atribacteraceae bacterium]
MKLTKRVVVIVVLGIMGGVLMSGCTASWGEPGRGAVTGGKVVIPGVCFVDYCVGDEPIPLSFARVTLWGDGGEVVVVNTDCRGEWRVEGLVSREFLLEARREDLVLKQVFTRQPDTNPLNLTTDSYTSAQVFVYEVANALFPDALYLEEVPDLVLPTELVAAVEQVYWECRNPFADPDLTRRVTELVNHRF